MGELEKLREMSVQDLAALGLHDLAYVRPVTEDGAEAFEVRSAAGERLAVVEDREIAFATIRGNDLEPVSVH